MIAKIFYNTVTPEIGKLSNKQLTEKMEIDYLFFLHCWVPASLYKYTLSQNL